MKTYPVHEIVTPIVAVPTVSIRKRGPKAQEKDIIAIQWFGVASGELPKDAQFIFEPCSDPHAACWLGHPTKFRIVFIGPVREWPKSEAREAIARLVTGGDLEGMVVYVVSGEFATWHTWRAGQVLQSFMCQLVVLGDPNCGVIYPRTYTNLAIIEEEMRRAETVARTTMTLADKLAEDYKMELPPETPAWIEGQKPCQACACLENSHQQKPVVPHRGNPRDIIYTCTLCGSRWWQYNTYYHLWKQVTEQAEWDILRRENILRTGGYELLEQ